jgi:hypothetical protein
VSGLLVAVGTLVEEALEVPVEDVDAVGAALLLAALEEGFCFVESFILHSITSFTHSYPSGQQPLPQVGSDCDVSVECKGD